MLTERRRRKKKKKKLIEYNTLRRSADRVMISDEGENRLCSNF